MRHDIEEKHPVNLGSWSFLQPGWWILHLVSVVFLFYLGYLLGRPIFG